MKVDEGEGKSQVRIILQQWFAPPATVTVKMCMSDRLDPLAFRNTKGRGHVVRHKRKKSSKKRLLVVLNPVWR